MILRHAARAGVVCKLGEQFGGADPLVRLLREITMLQMAREAGQAAGCGPGGPPHQYVSAWTLR